MGNFRGQLNLDRTVTKILKCFRTDGCRKQRNRFNIEKLAVLAEYFEQQADCNRQRRKISQSRGSPSWRNQQLFTFPDQTNGNHATQPSTVSYIISEQHWKSTFDFTEIVSNFRLNEKEQKSNCEIYFPIFSETIYIQFENIFTVRSQERYTKVTVKKQGVRIFGETFWLVDQHLKGLPHIQVGVKPNCRVFFLQVGLTSLFINFMKTEKTY